MKEILPITYTRAPIHLASSCFPYIKEWVSATKEPHVSSAFLVVHTSLLARVTMRVRNRMLP
jgi:hypothetical protein